MPDEYIRVNMDGQDYLQYKNWKNRPINKQFKNFLIGFLPLFFIALTVLIGGLAILDYMYPSEPFVSSVPNIMYIGGSAIPTYLMSGLVLSVGISWIIHGVGFVIIKR